MDSGNRNSWPVRFRSVVGWLRLGAVGLVGLVLAGPILLAFVRLLVHGDLRVTPASPQIPVNQAAAGQRQAHEALQTLPAKAYAALWQQEGELSPGPARQMLLRLADQAGMTIRFPNGRNLAERIALPVRARTRLEAIDETCDLLGLAPAVFGAELTLQTERIKTPVVFTGPFRVSATVNTERFATATGSLHVQAESIPFPKAMVALFGGAYPRLAVTQIRSAKGADLYHATRHRREQKTTSTQPATTLASRCSNSTRPRGSSAREGKSCTHSSASRRLVCQRRRSSARARQAV